MQDKLNKLAEFGFDINGALQRMCDDQDFYVECLMMVVEDPTTKLLKKAIDNNDVEQSFMYAHTLKGVLANVGATPLYAAIVPIVEQTRQHTLDNCLSMYNVYYNLFQEFVAIIL